MLTEKLLLEPEKRLDVGGLTLLSESAFSE